MVGQRTMYSRDLPATMTVFWEKFEVPGLFISVGVPLQPSLRDTAFGSTPASGGKALGAALAELEAVSSGNWLLLLDAVEALADGAALKLAEGAAETPGGVLVAIICVVLALVMDATGRPALVAAAAVLALFKEAAAAVPVSLATAPNCLGAEHASAPNPAPRIIGTRFPFLGHCRWFKRFMAPTVASRRCFRTVVSHGFER